MKTKLLLCAMAIFSFAIATYAQQADSRLWGTWEMQSAKQTTFQNGENKGTTNLQKADLMKENVSIPQDLFLLLYFFDNSVGACVVGKESSQHMCINEKGTFSTSGNNLTITLNKYQEFSKKYELVTYNLVYALSGSELTVNYRLPNLADAGVNYQYEIIFKQTSKE
jgi:hypothetical protein